MHELSAENVVAYLRDKGHVGPGPASAEELTGGVSNCVLRVTVLAPSPPAKPGGEGRGEGGERASVVEALPTDVPVPPYPNPLPPQSPQSRGGRGQEGAAGERLLIVKQSRPQLRTRQAWFSDVARILREVEAQRLLAAALPDNVPRVLFSEPDDFAYAMEHAPLDARPWKQLLLAGEIDPALARAAGALLRGVHAVTVPDSFRERTVFRQLRVDPFYRRIQETHPDLAPAVAPLIEAMETASLALCHGDFSPKNLLVSPGLTLVDHETCHLGEPAMDVGFFCSHLLLKAVRTPALADGYLGLIREALAGYGDEGVITRALPHLGVCVLARVDGTSPVDYLPGAWQKDAARAVGRIILGGRAATWCDALGCTLAELAGRTC